MAVSTSSYFSNAVPGENQIFPGNLFRTDDSPILPVGFRVALADGRVYRYAHIGAATNRGVIVAQDFSESGVVDTDDVVIAPASAVAVPGTNEQPGAVNSKFVQVTLAGVTANQFAGGYLHITDDSGEGYTYRIKGNTATNDPATGDIRLALYDRIQVALDATSDIAITGSVYANLEAATAATDTIAAGVTVSTFTAGQYGFIQTKGISTVLTDGVVVLGDAVELSDAVAGAVSAVGAFTDRQVGRVAIVGDDTGHSSIDLSIGN